jgi:phenylpropionate dioxygenase-like ring-hydroxylating dioxygenase large terminal subunit
MSAAFSMTSTPFSPSQSEAEKLHREIDTGLLLPTRWYSDTAIFKAELERIHQRSWHFATHTGDLKEAGDVCVRNIAGVPIVLVRDAERKVRGYINICRHRGHPVVVESGNRQKLRCHFHGWTYGLDGALQHAPRGSTDPTFDPNQYGLVPIQTHVWGPMIWANLDLKAPSFEQWIEGMPELMVANGLHVEDHVFGFDHNWDINSNWKVFQDNTIECYHCSTTHPELARVLEMKPELQKLSIGGRHWIYHSIPFRESFKGSITTKKNDGVPFLYYYHWIFPSTYLQYAGRGFDIGSLDIVAVDKIRFRHICFLPPDTPQETLQLGGKRLEVDATIQQDVDLCNRVQLGHMGGLAPTSRIFPQPEFLLSHFQHLIVDMMMRQENVSASKES